MVGGGSRRDEGSFVINNSNVFAALESLKKKKKSDKDKASKSAGKGSSKSAKEPEPAPVFWTPAPLTSKSWADVDDDDDDDYYATTAPPQSVWGEPPQSKEQTSNVEDTESEDDILDEGDEDVEEEHEYEHEPEVPATLEPVAKKPVEIPSATKETERQLSKKERKKKELAELEALLADFGVAPKENGQDESSDVPHEKKEGEPNVEGEKKESAPGESKSAKKKKKKDKSSKEAKDSQEQQNPEAVSGPAEVETAAEQPEDDASAVDVKERLKKMASIKKKKSSKEMDSAAKAATQEAAARNARLAAAKKKEKNHYNQQPVR